MEYTMSILLMYSDASDGLVGMIFDTLKFNWNGVH